MAGGVMQLVAYGAQDVYLTGNPQVSFFQAVYKRHTNFAMETIRQTLDGFPANGQVVSVTLGRMGDLVGDMFIKLTAVSGGINTSSSSSPYSSWMAERAIESVELTIGGQQIDKHYQSWWRLYSEVFLAESQKIKYGKMASTINSGTVYLPLLFFFNRNPGMYLPLIALQYHDTRLFFKLTNEYATYFLTGANTDNFQVWANYIYLEPEERRILSQKTHEYLIEQVGYFAAPLPTSSGTLPITLSHPVKEIIWCVSQTDKLEDNMWNFTYTSYGTKTQIQIHANGHVRPLHALGSPVHQSGSAVMVEESTLSGTDSIAPLSLFNIQLNGQARFAQQDGKYFNQYQPYQYHSGTPYPGIYVYSFALTPEKHQPSGSCNFSRIDNASITYTIKSDAYSAGLNTLNLFAVNYNVLRISGGMGGLAFSN